MPASNQSVIQTFIDYIKFQKRYSEHTVRSYHDDLIQLFDYLELQFGKISPGEIDHNHIRSWLASLKEKDITSKTINRKISSLKSFFKYLVKTGLLKQTPMSKIVSPKIGKRLPDFVQASDAERLTISLMNTEDWKSLNTKMLISLFYNTGMRLSELINLDESRVDFYKRQ
ncbi:MAG TPA: site-specific integrase, partial [Chitinophagaceae bacterium]